MRNIVIMFGLLLAILCLPGSASATIQYANQRCAGGNNQTTSGNSVTCTIPDSAGWSHTVSVFWCDASGCITTSTSGDTVAITDTQGNNYGSQLVRLDSASSTDRRALAIFKTDGVGSSSNTVTATVTSGHTVFGLAIFVSAWIVPSHALILDQSCAMACTDATAASSPISVATSATTTKANELIYGLFNLPTGTALTQGTNYTAISQFTSAQQDEYRVVSSAGVQAATMTYTGSVQQRAVLVSFYENPLVAGNYFLSATGNDGNSGTSSGSPWLTPNHFLTCGSTITAAASTSYLASTFTSGNWGTVSCPGTADVVWIKCVTFDACKISDATGTGGFNIDQSYWGVQGWEVTETASTPAGCFLAVPNFATQLPVHHNIFANNIANGCYSGGIAVGLSSTGSADYEAIIGNVAYDAAKGTACYSNINVLSPYNFDTQPGTHIYVAGNFSFKALNTPNCNSSNPATDGEGINIDTLDNGGTSPYTGQVVVDDNILVSNGGRGLEVELNDRGGTNAHVYLRHNTQWGNSADTNQTSAFCGDHEIYQSFNVESYWNLIATNAATACTGQTLYAIQTFGLNSTDHVYNDWAYSASGSNNFDSGSTGYTQGPNNTLGTNPNYANAVAPSAPSCGSFPSVPACMALLIANFTPTTAAAKAYGYQPPSAASVYDPLYPQWLCKVTNLPAGLITPGCVTGTAIAPGAPALSGASIH